MKSALSLFIVLLLLLAGTCASAGVIRDTSRLSTDTINTPKKKIDKRGEFSISSQYKSKDPYLGSYDKNGSNYFNQMYLGLDARYKTYFGLYFAISPDFLFNSDSIAFTGNYLTAGFEREWLEGFTTDLNYSYNVRQPNGGRRLRNLYANTVAFHAEYENDYITPELGYNFLFGPVAGGIPRFLFYQWL